MALAEAEQPEEQPIGGRVAGFFRNSAEFLKENWRIPIGLAGAALLCTAIYGSSEYYGAISKLPVAQIAVMSFTAAPIAIGLAATGAYLLYHSFKPQRS